MSEQTNIEWCDSTFNPWTGCTKVSPGCDNCYAEGWAKRSGTVQWGAHAERRHTSVTNWKQPVRWERGHEAFFAKHGRRQRVFCASLADVFDSAVPLAWRQSLMTLVADTPNLDWLFLTKRIGNARKMLTSAAVHDTRLLTASGEYAPPPNLWIGATVVNQEEADRDIVKLLHVPAAKRFLSIEPLLGPVRLDVIDLDGHSEIYPLRVTTGCEDDDGSPAPDLPPLDWVIAGGESGPNARPMHPDWARALRDECVASGVPFLFKQWGEWGPYVNEDHFTHSGAERRAHAWVDSLTAAHGKCWVVDDDGTWSNHTGTPPEGNGDDGCTVAATVAVMGWHGKKVAGRQLDGRTYDGFPLIQAPSPEPDFHVLS